MPVFSTEHIMIKLLRSGCKTFVLTMLLLLPGYIPNLKTNLKPFFMKKLYLSRILSVLLTIFAFTFLNFQELSAQTPGLIIKPAGTPGKSVLDPNGDGYTSTTNAGFISSDYGSGSEIQLTDLVRPDPVGDALLGPSGKFNDIVGATGLGDHAIETALINGNYIIRFRLDGYAPNSKTYAIFIDTDQKFGFTGPNADPNAIAGNPGFEVEISLHTNATVDVYNVDGKVAASSATSYPYDTNCQKSIALSTNSVNPDYFYDFYVPFSALQGLGLGVTPTTAFRLVAVTTMNPNQALGNNTISDVGGFTSGNNLDQIYTNLIAAETPTTPGQTVLDRSACPSISGPISTGATSISGTTSGAGTLINLFVNDVLAATTTTAGSSWTINGLAALSAGTAIRATAIAPGMGESLSDCNLTFVGSGCTQAPVFTGLTSGTKGVAADVIGPVGTVISLFGPNSDNLTIIYDNQGAIDIVNPAIPTTVINEKGIKIEGKAGQSLADGVYYLTAQASGSCVSSRTYLCVGMTFGATATPAVDAITPLSSNITGSNGVSGATIFVYANGALVGSKILSAAGIWSVSVQSSLICNTTITAQQIAPGYCISSPSAGVNVVSAVTSTPIITTGKCAAPINTVSGYSGESDGTTIQVYVDGTLRGSSTVSGGSWSYNTTAITTGQTITATATNSSGCKTVSAVSAGVTLTGTTSLTGSFTISSTVYEGAGSVPVTVSGISGTYTLNLYIDGYKIGSQSFTGSGVVTVPLTYAADIYTGGILTVSLTTGTQCESSQTGTLATVQCNIPSFALVVMSTPVATKCVATSGMIAVTNSQSMVIYTPVDNTEAVKGYSTLGNGGNISLNTYPFPSTGSMTFYLKAQPISSSGSCITTSTGSVTFNALSSPQFTTQPADKTVCSGGGTTITAAWTGTGTYNVQWQYNQGSGFVNLTDGGLYSQTSATGVTATTATLNISNVGTLDQYIYRCIVTDTGNPSECQVSTSNSSKLSVVSVTISNAVITNATPGNNGAINVTPSGGDGSYSYDWHYNYGAATYSNQKDLTGIAGGTYTVTVMDGTGCPYQQSFTVGGIGSVNLALVSQTNITCYGTNNGQIVVSSSAGTTPYSYSTDNFVTLQSSGTFTGLLPGNYTLKARDANSVASNSVAVTITQPNEIVISATISNPSISDNDGSIYVTLTAGTANFTVILYNSSNVALSTLTGSSTSYSFTGLTNGTYYINVTDAKGCTASKTNIVLTLPVTTTDQCTQTAAHTFNDGSYSGYSGSYNYFSTPWVKSDPSNPNINMYNQALAFGQMPADNKSISWTVPQSINRHIDLLGATSIVVSFTISTVGADSKDNYSVGFYVNNNPVATYAVNNTTNYSVKSTITFSTGITYNTVIGNSTNTFEFRLPAGSARSNFQIDDFTITFAKPITTGITTAPSTCGDGIINLGVIGGYPPYTYSCDMSVGETGSFSSTKNWQNLTAGAYHITITDLLGCATAIKTATVASAPLTASITATTNPTCAGGGSNGDLTATISATGGGGPFTYQLIQGASTVISTLSSASALKTFTGLGPGTYQVKITQASGGCNVQTSPLTLTLPTVTSSITSTGTTTICYGTGTTVAIAITGGTSPYLVALNNGQVINNYTSGTNITVTPGSTTTISVSSISDAISCVSSNNTGSVLLTVNPVTAISSQSTATQSQCIAGTFTPITVTATGTGTLTYQWYKNASASTSGGTSLVAANGAQTSRYTPQATTAGTLYYYCIVHGGCGADITSAVSGAFIVNQKSADPTSATASLTTICNGASTTLTLNGGGGGTGEVIKWYTASCGGTPAGTGISLVVSPTTTTTYYGRYEDGTPCSYNSICASVTITVNPVSVGGTVTGGTTICSGSTSTLLSLAGQTGSVTKWQSSLDGTIWNDIVNTATTYTPGVLTQTTQFRAVVTSGVCSSANSLATTVTVTPTVTINAFAPATSTRCQAAGNVTTTTTASNSTGITYSMDATTATFAGNSIVAATGAVTYAAGWSGTTTITASAAGCNGPATTTHNVTVIPDGSWTGAIDNDWNNPLNWACGQLPTITTNVLIAGGKTHYPLLSTSTTDKANNLTIASGATVVVDGNTLQIAGIISNSGTFTATAGTIEMTGASAQTIPDATFSTNTIQNLIANNPLGVTLDGNLNITGILRANSSGLDIKTGKFLTLISTATQTALIDGSGTGNVTGNVTMQRYLSLVSASGYKYFSSPFNNAKVSQFTSYLSATATIPTFYRYDEDNHTVINTITMYSSGWVKYIVQTDPLFPMVGYAANLGIATASKTVEITGVVNNGGLAPIALYNNNRDYTKGFNLIGNPYPSPIDWKAAAGWTKTNIDDAIYFFDASGAADEYSGFYSYLVNGVATSDHSSIIPSMQGFFIHVTDGLTGSLRMSNSVRTNDLNPVFKAASFDPRTILRFAANFETKNAIADAAVIYFDDQANRSFDKDKDALKMMNTDLLAPNLYTISSDTRQLSINGMPQPADSTSKIPMGITTLSDGWINLNAKDISKLPSSLHIYLVDAEQGVTRDLKQQPEYRFYLKKGEYNARFTLVFSLADIVKLPVIAEKMFAISHSGNLLLVKVNLPLNISGNLLVTNVLGQLILQRPVSEIETVEVNPYGGSSIYIVTLVSGNRKESEKILIRKDYE